MTATLFASEENVFKAEAASQRNSRRQHSYVGSKGEFAEVDTHSSGRAWKAG
jgi:hypothetical protein